MTDDGLKNIWKVTLDEELDLIEKSSMINEVQSEIKSWDNMVIQQRELWS